MSRRGCAAILHGTLWKQGHKAEITMRMLLNHTSGLQNVANTSVEIYPASARRMGCRWTA